MPLKIGPDLTGHVDEEFGDLAIVEPTDTDLVTCPAENDPADFVWPTIG
jgi:hypothetical protein